MKRPVVGALLAAMLLAGAALCALIYAKSGLYGFNVIRLRGMSLWSDEPFDGPRLSPSMRLALRDTPPVARAGSFTWRSVAEGFEVAELPVLVDEAAVADSILLARVDPRRYRFEARNAPLGNWLLDDWMAQPGTILVINGSYYARDGLPDTPFLSNGTPLGPRRYDATHGAFVASDAHTGIRDLARETWETAFAGAHDGMVSYPLLLAADGSTRVAADQRWLSNRSFVAEDAEGRIILGTTTDAFFTLTRLAAFLKEAPLGLTLALNLDGGPVACQGIVLGDYVRRFCGQWEFAVQNGTPRLLRFAFGSYGRWALPIVLVVRRR